MAKKIPALKQIGSDLGKSAENFPYFACVRCILSVIVAKNGKLPNQHAFFWEVGQGVKRFFFVEAAQCDEGDACSSCEH